MIKRKRKINNTFFGDWETWSKLINHDVCITCSDYWKGSMYVWSFFLCWKITSFVQLFVLLETTKKKKKKKKSCLRVFFQISPRLSVYRTIVIERCDVIFCLLFLFICECVCVCKKPYTNRVKTRQTKQKPKNYKIVNSPK